MYKPGDKVTIRSDLKEYECYLMLSGPKKRERNVLHRAEHGRTGRKSIYNRKNSRRRKRLSA